MILRSRPGVRAPRGHRRLRFDAVREEPTLIAGRLEATLRVPEVTPLATAVVTHPLPTHGGTMRNPLIAAIARACAERGWYALRFNFRGTGASRGSFTGGREEAADVADAVAHARGLAPVPVGLAGFSFGALMILRWLAAGGSADAIALAGVPLRSVSLEREDLPPVPDGTFIVCGENDQFGSAAELRAALPRARIAEVRGADHFFGGRHREVAALIAESLARDLRLA
ncbi:alpha/beta hydrolase [soil metagenome]